MNKMRTRRRTSFAAAVALLALLVAGGSALAVPPDYVIINLGTINPDDFASSGDDASPALGIATGRNSGDGDQAFTWAPDADFVALPNFPTRAFCRGNGVNDLGVKSGPFWVLIGGHMPSVLVEISHLSNSQEENRLRTDAYKQKIAQGIYAGILDYIDSLAKGPTK